MGLHMTGSSLTQLNNAYVKRTEVIPSAFPNSFTAGGTTPDVSALNSRAYSPINSHVEGDRCHAHEYSSHAEGSTTKADGKISHAEGNCSVCSANDSHAEGNRTVAGRRYYRPITAGSEDAGDGLGVLEYALIPDSFGDVTSFFPNRFTDNVTARYGAGASMDTLGNIYGSTVAAAGVNTPAVWADPVTISLANNAALSDTAPDPVPLVANDLKWALHSWCILRGGPSETAIAYARIAKSTYTAGTGTKVYYFGHYPGATFTGFGIMSSYSPVVLSGGNGMHSEGFITSAWNYGAHSEGQFTSAWANAAHSEGRETQALAAYAHSGGYQTKASGVASRATGQQAIATQDYEVAHSAGMRTVAGDNQRRELHYNKSHDSASGWGTVPLVKNCADGLYDFESTVMGYQTVGPGGTVGNSFVYRFRGAVTVRTVSAVTSMTPLGPIVRELVGRTGPVNDVQSLMVTGIPTGGTFTLTFGGNTTAGIAYNATPAAVQAALEALASIGVGNVSVTSTVASGGPWRVEFIGTLAGADQAALTASGAGLTGGTSPGIAVSNIVDGSTTTMTGDGYTTGDRLTEQSDLYTAAGAKDIIARLDQAGTTTYYTTTHTRVRQILA